MRCGLGEGKDLGGVVLSSLLWAYVNLLNFGRSLILTLVGTPTLLAT
jgi:hypothetical protein